MVDFLNSTGVIGSILQAGTENVTGSMVATLFLIFIFLIIVAVTFSIPLEFTAVILLPVAISMGSYYSNFIAPLVVILLYLSTIIAKNWIFR